jgi:glycosyltransferase involved in cell wall biosynthesis
MSKILVVSSTYPANRKHNVPDFVKEQLSSISKKYPEIEFISLSPHDYGFTDFLENNGSEIRQHRFRYFYPKRFENITHFGILPTLKSNRFYYFVLPFFLIFEFIAILKYAKRYRIDLIYAHWFMPQGLLSVIAGRWLNVPVCFTSHSSDVEIMSRMPFGSLFVCWAVRRSTRVSAVSRRSYDKIRKFFSDKEWRFLSSKVDIIPMGTSVFPDRTSREFNGSQFKLLFIGRLVEKKGLYYLIHSINQLKSEGIVIELNIGGVGPLESQLKRLVVDLSLQDIIHFHGFVSGHEKKNLLDSTDFFILPSIVTREGDMEGLPVSLIEAMASGCVCIATTISGADDIIIDGDNGFLINPYSVESIVYLVKSVLKFNSYNLIRISDNAKLMAQHYTWDVIGFKYYQFLLASLKNDKNPVVK